MTSEAQKKKGFLLPETLTGYQLQCVSLMIPRNEEYRMAFLGHLYELARWWVWEKSYQPGDKRALEASVYWEQLISDTLVFDDCDPDVGCTEFAPDSAIIQYFPNDPYKTPDLTPEGYYFPPWYVAGTVNVVGAAPGDVVTDIVRISSGSAWTSPLPDPPRFRITVQGTGVLELHLVTLFQGGRAQVQVDGDILSLRWVDTHRDVTSAPPETQDVIVIPIELTTPGEHFIDVTAIPTVNDEITLFGFGFGLRKVVLCGFDQPPAEPGDAPMFQFDGDRCVLQYSTNGGLSWTDVPGWEDFALACFQGEPGLPGAPGEPGAPGAPGGIDDNATDVPPPALPPGGGAECGIATAVATAVRDVYYLPMLETYILQTVTNGQSHLDFVRYLQTQYGFLGLGFSVFPTLIAWVQMIQADDANTLYSNTNTAAFLDALICDLHCALIELAADSMTEDVRALWLEKFMARTTLDGRAVVSIVGFIQSITLATLRTEALFATLNPSGCDDCGCDDLCAPQSISWSSIGATPSGWSSFSTLPPGLTNPQGFNAADVASMYSFNWLCSRVPFDAWTKTYPPGNMALGIKFTFPEPCLVESLEFGSIIDNINSKLLAIAAIRDDDTFELLNLSRRSAPSLSQQNLSWTGDGTDMFKEVYFLWRGGDPNTSRSPRINGSQINYL